MYKLSRQGIRTHMGVGPEPRCLGSRQPPGYPLHKDARAFVA